MHEQIYEIARLGSNGQLSFLVILLIMAGLLVFLWLKPMPEMAKRVSLGLVAGLALVFGWTWYKVQSANIALDMSKFELDVPFYGVSLKRSEILVTGIRPLDLQEEPGLKPDFRSNGFGMPGFQLGWFRLQDGQKALLAVGEGDQLVIPTKAGFVIIVSSESTDRLINAL